MATVRPAYAHQLRRPVLLVCFPHLYGVLLAAVVQNGNAIARYQHHYRADSDREDGNVNSGTGPDQLLEAMCSCVLLLAGSAFYSMAAHAWNDIVDAPLDRLVARTRNRPIARGAISTRAALVLTPLQAALAASFFLALPQVAAVSAIPISA